MAATTSSIVVRFLEKCRVSATPDSVAGDTSVPLTFFDMVWVNFHPVERLFFYELPQPTSCLVDTVVPNLKRSLSQTLQHFYPLAGILRPNPDDSTRHEIHYSPGDSVSLTLAECDGDMGELLGNQPREVNLLLPLVPRLERVGTTVAGMALQVTLFPNSGFCIGLSIHHAVCDGSGSVHFLKSWASACRSEKVAAPVKPVPFHDRKVLGDLDGLYTTLRNEGKKLKAAPKKNEPPPKSSTEASPVVISTIILKREQIQRLKDWVSSRRRQINFSTFVVTSACVWVSLTRAQGEEASPSSYFVFAVDARTRLQRQIPTTYFGNCLTVAFVEAPRSALMTEDGVLVASEAIVREIKALERDALGAVGEWPSKFSAWGTAGVLSVAGSPRFGIYEIDFGWGRPLKVEVISIRGSGAMSLAECREEKGGVEIGLTRPLPQMEEFRYQFANVLKNLKDDN